MTESAFQHCAAFQACQLEQASRWAAQEQRNEATNKLFRRWGARLDRMDTVISECQSTLSSHLDYAAQMRQVLSTMQEQMEGTTTVLGELAVSIKESRESAERNHADLLSAVAANASVAARAVDRADKAAERADAARVSSGESAGRLTTMTRATLAGWIAATAAAATLVWHLITDYGWPYLKAHLP